MTQMPASGTQHELEAGDYRAVVASVGASLRTLTFRGRDLVVPFDADEVRPAYRGATLAPWPNRIVDGRYVFGGEEHGLALTEPARGHALHGLLAWSPFATTEGGVDRLALRATIEPQAGYPWRMLVESVFELSGAGLIQSVRARNESAAPAPWGTGPHPYLVAGAGCVDEWTLLLPAGRVLEIESERLVPTMLVPVAHDAARFDYRIARPLGAVELDHAYTDLDRDADGIATVELTAATGGGVAMSWDRACAWVQIHTADLAEGGDRSGHRAGLAVEPMTCAPDAFNASAYEYDAGLQVVPPGEWSTVASWRIRALD